MNITTDTLSSYPIYLYKQLMKFLILISSSESCLTGTKVQQFQFYLLKPRIQLFHFLFLISTFTQYHQDE